MQAHEERVVAEKQDLDGKIAKLSEFVGGGIYRTLPEDDQDLLVSQLDLMKGYSAILARRIERFTV